MTPPSCWLIIGAGSAIARAFAHQIAAPGDIRIILAGRDRQALEHQAADLTLRHGVQVAIHPLDVLDFAQHADFARALAEQTDLSLFYAVGKTPDQAETEADPALAQDCIDVNYTAAVSLLLHLAPVFLRNQTGRIIVIGSVAGDRGRLSNYVYGAAKAGLHTFLQGFSLRMRGVGVPVLTVKPGFVDTAMTWGLPVPLRRVLMASPHSVAQRCIAHSGRGGVLYAPGFWRAIMIIIRALPDWLLARLRL